MKTLKEFKEEYQIDELSTDTYKKYKSGATNVYNMKRLFNGSPKKQQASSGLMNADKGIERNNLNQLQKHIGSDKETAIAVRDRIKEFLGKSYDHNDDLHKKAALQIYKRLSEDFELEEDCGAYETWDPKHPNFVKNYKKYQKDNAGKGSIKDFIDKEKARPRRLPK